MKLSTEQQEIYFGQLKDLESTIYNVGSYIIIQGELDFEKFSESLCCVADEFEVFRYGKIQDKDLSFSLNKLIPSSLINLVNFSTCQNAELKAFEFIDEKINQILDIHSGNYFRFFLLKTEEKKHVFFVMSHHIFMDGFSISQVFFDSIFRRYKNLVSSKKEPGGIKFQKFDLKRIASKTTAKKEGDLGWEFWINKFSKDRNFSWRETAQSNSSQSALCRIDFEEVTQKGILKFCKENNLTFQDLVICGLSILYEKQGFDQFDFSYTIHNRRNVVEKSSLGVFSKVLPARLSVETKTVADRLESLKKMFRQDYRYSEFSTGLMITKLQSMSAAPFDLRINYMPFNLNVEVEGLVLQADRVYPKKSNIPLEFNCCNFEVERRRKLCIDVVYNVSCFSANFIDSLQSQLVYIIRQIIVGFDAPISEIEMVDKEERELLEGFNPNSNIEFSKKTMVDLFCDQVKSTPDKLALVCKDKEFSFKELDELSNRFANYLLDSYGIEEEELIGLKLERNEWLVIAILGILKSGGAYVPIDLSYPEKRQSFIEKDAGFKVCIDAVEIEKFKIKNYSGTLPFHVRTQPNHLAYVIYTSGSTGNPKGVLIEHRNAVAFLDWCHSEFKNSDFEYTLFVTSVCFDLSVYEIFYTLTGGKTLIVLEDALSIPAHLNGNKKLLLNTVPSVVGMLLSEGHDLSALSVLNMAGEAIPTKYMELLKKYSFEIRNLYGPSEDTTYSTVYRIDPRKDEDVLIGKPILGSQVYILSGTNQLLPIGTVGEICIGGAGLARGYLNSPELTQEKFLNHPFIKGERLYRTGDLGSWKKDGNLLFIGRKDTQVKIRGHRIELGEIEHTLQLNKEIDKVVVVDRKDNNGDVIIVAYFTSAADLKLEDLKEDLAKSLPEYMIPGFFVQLESLPLTPNGKLDKQRLPDPQQRVSSIHNSYVAPRNAIEQELVFIWKRILKIEKVGVNDNFFAIGGHSLKLVELKSQIVESFNKEINLRELFEFRTIRKQHGLIARASTNTDYVIIPAKPENDYPLTRGQLSFWIQSQLVEDQKPFHMPGFIELSGDFSADAVQMAFEFLADRHEILRTNFRKDAQGEVRQFVSVKKNPNFQFHDLSHEKDSKSQIGLELKKDFNSPFDLEKDDLYRLILFKLSSETYQLYVNFHHIIGDAQSIHIIINEFMVCCDAFRRNTVPQLSGLLVQYKDFAVWQRQFEQTEAFRKQELYWIEKLQGEIPQFSFASDKKRPPLKTYLGTEIRSQINIQLTQMLKSFSQENWGSLFITVLASWNLILYKYTGVTDLIIGTPVSDRDKPGLRSQVGFYINTLPLRNKIDPEMSFLTFYESVKDTVLNALANKNISFERLLESIEFTRDSSRSPLFDVMLTFENLEVSFDQSGKVIRPQELEHKVARYDMELAVHERENELDLNLVFNPDLYDSDRMEQLLVHFIEFMKNALSKPHVKIAEIDCLTPHERTRLLENFNKGKALQKPLPENIRTSLNQSFESNPVRTAVIEGGREISYASLAGDSEKIASYLNQEYQVGPGDYICVQLKNSYDLVRVLVGILKTGAAFVPLDLSLPDKRREFILEETNSHVLINFEELEKIDSKEYPILPLNSIGSGEDPAYIIYTSGSTGQPKGVLISQSNLAAKFAEEKEVFNLDKLPVTLAITNPAFDVSLLEILYPLCNSGTIVIPSQSEQFDIDEVGDLMVAYKVNILQGTPTFLSYVIEGFDTGIIDQLNVQLQVLCVGGESMSKNQFNLFKRRLPGVRINNHYGPTETTIDCIVAENLQSFDTNIIGRPLSATRVAILRNNQVCPVGVFGEIVVCGPSVAKGYFVQSKNESNSAFSKDFIFGSDYSLYRTGDVARWTADGNIEFRGRKDDQVKLRGFRIELQEIESVVQSHPGVKSGVISLIKNGDKSELSAYVVKSAVNPVFWPSVGEYPLYDELLYHAMTNDVVRNRHYERAVESAVKGKTVVDIGTGKDAYLALLSIKHGAKKVYAIETDSRAFEQAKEAVMRQGLGDKIELIYGNSLHVEIPEKVDVCISELIGNIGGSEGALHYLNNAMRFLKNESGILIPQKCVTKIAAFQLPESLKETPVTDMHGEIYFDSLAGLAPGRFSPRLCIKNCPPESLISDTADFEILKFNSQETFESRDFQIKVLKKSRVDGFLLWIQLYTDPTPHYIDSLNDLTNWMPVYLHVFDDNQIAEAGDVIEGKITITFSENGINPDYRLTGKLIRKETSVAFEHHSRYDFDAEVPRLVEKLLENGSDFTKSITSFVQARVPHYMVPSQIHFVEDIPLRSNGKIDHKALNDLIKKEFQDTETLRPLFKDDIANQVFDVWVEVLKTKTFSITDTFFQAGGNSLSIIRLKSELEKVFTIKLKAAHLFRDVTIGAQSELIYILMKEGVSETTLDSWRLKESNQDVAQDDIAIVGMSVNLPGAESLQEFWDNLVHGKESIKPTDFDKIPDSMLGFSKFIERGTYVNASSYLNNKSFFDANWFGYTPAEANLIDPQARVFHEVVWNALQDAGIDPFDTNKRIGLFAGGKSNLRWELLTALSEQRVVDEYMAGILSDKDFMNSLIAHKLNFTGPVESINTACSTSLVAVHEAAKSIRSGESDVAIAGGVTVHPQENHGYVHVEGMIFSNNGQNRTFDKDSSGTISGEGAGAIVLKSIKKAIQDGDHIYAIVKGSAINNDGALKIGYTAPSLDGQVNVLRQAYENANVLPSTIGYIEAHGTATKLGDAIEVEALNMVFGKHDKPCCALGSVKSNLGHLDSAAGIVGLIKSALCLEYGQLVPTLHYTAPNKEIDFGESAFYVNTDFKKWERNRTPLRAGVSSFGIGGTNAHVVIEEYNQKTEISKDLNYQLFPFSAKSQWSLDMMRRQMIAYLEKNPQVDLERVAFTLQHGRRNLSYRWCCAAKSKDDLIDQLSREVSAYPQAPAAAEKKLPLVFMFPGQGNQYPNMAGDLYKCYSVFRKAADECFDIISGIQDLDLKRIIFNADNSLKALDQTINTQPAIFVIEYALFRLLESYSIKPDVVIGHSIGEFAAACAAGVLDLEDALRMIVTRGTLMQRLPIGVMSMVYLDPETLLDQFGTQASIAAINTNSSCVISGEEKEIEKIEEELKSKGLKFKRLITSHAFHSKMMKPMLTDFDSSITACKISRVKIPFVSTSEVTFFDKGHLLPKNYWTNQIINPVHFAASKEIIIDKGFKTFLEIGPGGALSAFISDTPKRDTLAIIQTTRRESEIVNDEFKFLQAIGKLWETGYAVNWDLVAERKKGLIKISLPPYPFERNRFSVGSELMDILSSGNILVKPTNKLNNWLYVPNWKRSVLPLVHMPFETKGFIFFAEPCSVHTKIFQGLRDLRYPGIVVQRGAKFEILSNGLITINPDNQDDVKGMFDFLKIEEIQINQIIYGWNVPDKDQASLVLAVLFFKSVCEKMEARYPHFEKKFTFMKECNLFSDEPVNSKVGCEVLGAVATGYSQEISNVFTTNLFYSFTKNEAKLIDILVGELLFNFNDKQVFYKSNKRWSLDFDEVADLGNQSGQFPSFGGTYLITGGLGKIGLRLAEELAVNHMSTVIITGRTKISNFENDKNESYFSAVKNKFVENYQCLKDSGADIHYYQSDVSDFDVFANTISAIEQKHGTLKGIIHAAGNVESNYFKPFLETTEQDLNTLFQAKVTGMINVYELFKERQMDFVWITSSLSTVLGGKNMAAYSGANSFMDEFILQREEELTNWVSVSLDGITRDRIDSDKLFELFCGTLRIRNHPRIIVSVQPIKRAIENSKSEPADQRVKAKVSISRPNLRSLYVAPESEFELDLASIWTDFFGFDRIGVNDNFFELGGDSLKAMVLINLIDEKFSIQLQVEDFFGDSSIKHVAAILENRIWLKNTPEKKNEIIV